MRSASLYVIGAESKMHDAYLRKILFRSFLSCFPVQDPPGFTFQVLLSFEEERIERL